MAAVKKRPGRQGRNEMLFVVSALTGILPGTVCFAENPVEFTPTANTTVTAFFGRAPDETGNYVRNGDFGSDTTEWTFNVWGGSASGIVTDGEYRFSITSIGEEKHSIQLMQDGLLLKRDEMYEVRFDAYADAARNLEVNVQMAVDPYVEERSPELSTA